MAAERPSPSLRWRAIRLDQFHGLCRLLQSVELGIVRGMDDEVRLEVMVARDGEVAERLQPLAPGERVPLDLLAEDHRLPFLRTRLVIGVPSYVDQDTARIRPDCPEDDQPVDQEVGSNLLGC